jgi:heme-degrading monooxygenase HmoA
VPALVTLHVWTVPGRDVPRSVLDVSLDRRRARHTPGVTFAKLLGTTAPGTFTPRGADPRRWALLTCWDDPRDAAAFERSELVRRWDARSQPDGRQRVAMTPLSSRGEWGGRRPFGDVRSSLAPVARTDGPVAVLTRARLRSRLLRTFWRAVPAVAESVQRHDGLVTAFGLGEAPVILQGTFSLWRSAEAMASFAYGSPEHQRAIASTRALGWYAEELFARFSVVESSGYGSDDVRAVGDRL